MYVPEHLTEIFTFENLLKAFRSSASNHRHKEDVQEFLNHLYLNIRRIEKTFKKGEYPEITYHSFVVKQPKLRVVWATSFEIRVIQHCFCDVFLTPFFEQIYVPRNCACRKDKGTDYAANCLKADLKYYYRENADLNSGYVLKADIHHYFQSIDHDILKRMLHPILPDGEVKNFLFYIIDSFDKGGLPLGNQTSQLLALYYLHPVDILIQNKYGVMFDYGALFSRYMDDFALIAEDKQTLIDAYRDIDFILRNALNLCFNDKTSIHPLKNGIGFLGWNYYLLKNGRVLKKRKKDAKDRAKKKVKLAIYLYEENIIDARSYGNRITSVLATLKKGDAGAFQRTLIHMQYSYSDKLRKKDSIVARIDGGVSNPGYFIVISNKPLEVQQASIPKTNEETVNQYKNVEMPPKEPDKLESSSEQNETESQQ